MHILWNGCNKDHIRIAVRWKQYPKLKYEKPIWIVRLSYHKSYSNKISRLLEKLNIRMKKTIQMLRSGQG
jgi:hypothetical protein